MLPKLVLTISCFLKLITMNKIQCVLNGSVLFWTHCCSVLLHNDISRGYWSLQDCFPEPVCFSSFFFVFFFKVSTLVFFKIFLFDNVIVIFKALGMFILILMLRLPNEKNDAYLLNMNYVQDIPLYSLYIC